MATDNPLDIDGTFFVQRVVIHEIPKARLADKGTTTQGLADLPVSLSSEQKDYFRRRIVGSLAKHFQVVHDTEISSPVPQAVVDFFSGEPDDESFVSLSQLIARHLFAVQPGGSNAGLAAVIEGTVGSGKGSGKCLVLLKLEQESGVKFDRRTINGKTTYEVTLQDVTMTNKTKVFKAALFERCDSLSTIAGRLSDDQLTQAVLGRELAEFFMATFLGCKLRDLPSIATKRMVEQITDFINGLEAPDEKTRLSRALRTEIESNKPTINIEAWAEDHLSVGRRDDLVNRFRADDGSISLVQKDDELIRPLFNKMVVEFDNKVRVTGPPDQVEKVIDALRLARTEDGEVAFGGRVKKVR